MTQTATARAETASEEEAERPDDLALLRHARRALAHGEPRSAFEDLDALARSFPKTLYAEEAAALRIEALATVGDVTAARALADRFHVHYPASPYAHRVRSLAGR